MSASCFRLSARVIDELVSLLALLAYGVVLATDAVLYQLRTGLTLIVLSEAVAILAGGTEC